MVSVLLRHLPFGIDHVTKTLFQQFHFLPLPVAYGSQFDVRFQEGVFVEYQPVIGSAGIDKGDLQIGCLLTGVYLRRSDQMIDEKASFALGATMRSSFIPSSGVPCISRS